jgi:hypothetical protein
MEVTVTSYNILSHNVPLQTEKLPDMKYYTSAFGTSKHWSKKNLYCVTDVC